MKRGRSWQSKVSIGKRSEKTLITPYTFKLLEGTDVRAHQLGNPRMRKDGTLGGSPPRMFFEVAPATAAAVAGEFSGYLDFLVSKLEK